MLSSYSVLIKLNDIALSYDMSGVGEPLFLIGGATANCREWARMHAQLARHFTVYRPENRGAGLTSGWTDDFSIEHMADDIALLMSELAIESAYVVGHSMGGAITQRLCINYPQRVKAAILASSFAHFPKAALLYLESSSILFAAGLEAEVVLKTIYTRLYGSNFLSQAANIQAELQRMLTDPVPQTPRGYQAQVRAIAQFDARDDLARIACPVLVVNGQEDVLTPSYLSEELKALIPQARLAFISNCGHMIPQEKPVEFSQIILDFFIPIGIDFC